MDRPTPIALGMPIIKPIILPGEFGPNADTKYAPTPTKSIRVP